MSSWPDWSDDLIIEQECLVSAGVRPLALIGDLPLDEGQMGTCFSRLRYIPSAKGDAIPFVIPHKAMNVAYAGYASETWILDMLKWLYATEVPEWAYHCIMGLLLGYSPDRIGRFIQQSLAASPFPIGLWPKIQDCGSSDTDQTSPQL